MSWKGGGDTSWPQLKGRRCGHGCPGLCAGRSDPQGSAGVPPRLRRPFAPDGCRPASRQISSRTPQRTARRDHPAERVWRRGVGDARHTWVARPDAVEADAKPAAGSVPDWMRPDRLLRPGGARKARGLRQGGGERGTQPAARRWLGRQRVGAVRLQVVGPEVYLLTLGGVYCDRLRHDDDRRCTFPHAQAKGDKSQWLQASPRLAVESVRADVRATSG